MFIVIIGLYFSVITAATHLQYRMIDIEEFSNLLRQSESFKALIIEQVNHCIDDRQSKNKSEEETPLPQLTKQIAGQLLEITQLVLEEQNSCNYLNLMKSSQDLCCAIQKKIELEFQEKIDALNKRIDQLTVMLQQTTLNVKKTTTNQLSPSLKQQRKTITKSILDNSRSVTNSKTKSSITPRKIKQIRFEETEEEQKNKQMIQTNDSRSYPSLEEDFTFEDQQVVEYKHLLSGFKKNVEEMNIQQKKIQQSFAELSQKLQFKLQNNLECLWNVLGDLNARLAKFQSGESQRPYAE